jgi:arylsulfatase A
MKQKLFRVAALSTLALLLSGNHFASAAEKAATEKPNIIFILSDDAGLGDVHCTGGQYDTPNIDALAAGGTRFEYCYATPLCGPSRCQALTGRYPFRTGLISNHSEPAIADRKEIMIPTLLKKAGYVTASVGKWGQMPYGPGEWGFDEWFTFHGSGRYWREQTAKYQVNGRSIRLRKGQYVPDLMHSFIVNFLEKHKDQPFFLYYPMVEIHNPIVRTPESKKGGDKAQHYADNIEYMDKLVGKLVAKLERLHLREKTLIVFTSDNGTALFAGNISKVDDKPIIGGKGAMLEGGSRVPLIVNWPGTTPPGKVCHDLTDFSDFFGTFTELAGAAIPDGLTIDSHSIAPQIKGEPGSPREWIYMELNGRSYARDARYKLTNAGILFDLKNAPFEEIPVPENTTDPETLAAKKKLQAVLHDHPALAPAAKAGNRKEGPEESEEDD